MVLKFMKYIEFKTKTNKKNNIDKFQTQEIQKKQIKKKSRIP